MLGRFAASIASALLFTTPAFAADTPTQACAAAARYPTADDPTGTVFDKLDAETAIPLCEAALTANPDDHASRANLARALAKAGRHEEKVTHLRRAVEGGNLQAMRQLALALEVGDGVPEDRPAAFALMKRTAEAGYVPAMDTLGLYYSSGTGVAEDDAAGLVWTRKAVAAGDAMATNNLGAAYADGEGVPKDPVEAHRLYALAAAKGVNTAMRNLGDNFRLGRGVARDFEAAVSWYRRAIEAGDIESYEQLGYALDDRDNPRRDTAKAVETFRLGDEAGAAGSTYALGSSIAWGSALPRDFVAARRLFERASAAGSTAAMVELGLLHERGLGGASDIAKANALYRQAADEGDGRAMRFLGHSYASADGVARDYVQALSWFRKAAEAEDADGFADVGLSYERGEGVAEDAAQAISWYQKGRAAGSSRATQRLAAMMARGAGVPQDHAGAAKLYREAADAGDVNAMCFLADAYFWGLGVAQDHQEAERWLTKAAELGGASDKLKLGERYFRGDRTAIDYGKARKLFAEAAELGDRAASEWAVRATLADVALRDRESQTLTLLERKAAAGEGWALAALAWPGASLKGLTARIESAKWRAAASSVNDPSQLIAMSEALKSGHLAEQDFGQALALATRAGGGDPFGAAEHQLGLLAELKLTRAALARYETFTLSPGFLAATPDRQASFRRVFVRRMAGRWQADERSLGLLESLAAEGVGEAAKALGDFYAADGNPRRDYAEATMWYERAAALGIGSANLSLGYMHGTARGRAEDAVAAVGYYRKAAEAGESTARANLGFMYLTGRGVPQNDAESARWYALAAENGDNNARYWLARLRFAGRGGPADPVEAIRLLREAIDCAHEASRIMMAQAYFEGAGVARDPEEGLRWMRLAAAYPDSRGQLGMARAAALGWGMAPDYALARTYLIEARKRGDEDAAKWLDLCGERAGLACLLAVPDFRPEPLMREPVPHTRAPRRDFAGEERRLRTALQIAIAENASEFDIAVAFSGLEQLYMLHGKTDALIPAALHRVIQREAQLTQLYGRADNYFALFDASCAWSNASKNASVQGRKEAAVLFAKVAVNKLQLARQRIADLDDDIRECFVEAHRDRYRQLAETFLDMGRFEEAENVLAMLKDFEHASWTGGSEGRGRSLAMMPMTASQRAVLTRIERASAASAAWAEARARKADAALAETAFDAAIAEAGRALAALETDGGLTIAAEAPARPRVQAVLVGFGRSDVAALQVVTGPSRIHWLLTTVSGQKVIPISVDLSVVAQAVRAYRKALIDVDPEAQAQATAIFKLVFAPVDAELRAAGATQVMLSLDDVLRYVPFAALHDGTGWLVERYAFSNFRDASDLAETGARREWTVAGFGATRALAGFAALPKVTEELSGIVQSRGGLLPGTVALDAEFDQKALGQAVAGDSAVIHIASHFALDSRGGGESFLLLGTGEKLPLAAFGKAGTMRFKNADFLALSACQTGLAAPGAKGVEIESMAEIAQNAGAPAVLASLWKVADDSTSRLMVSFYGHRSAAAAPTKSAALRLAQLDLIAEGRKRLAAYQGDPEDAPANFAHPFFWAPFVLLGDAT